MGVISIKDVVTFLQQLGQVDQQSITPSMLEEWEKKYLNLRHRLCSDTTKQLKRHWRINASCDLPERKTIEKAIKAVASYHAPGKYMLKEGVSFAKPSPGGGGVSRFSESIFSLEIPAAETPPLVDSPAIAELAPDAVPKPLKEPIAPRELGLFGERPRAPLGARPDRLSSFTMQKCNGNRVSCAINKADEKLCVNVERFQQSIIERMISHNLEFVSLQEPSPYSHDAELISIKGDESPEQDMMDT
ncbi:unnamed protein product [Sphagnum compactum]